MAYEGIEVLQEDEWLEQYNRERTLSNKLGSQLTERILLEKLATIDYFDNLSSEDLLMLARASISRTYDAGQTIFYEGEPATGLWIVQKGRNAKAAKRFFESVCEKQRRFPV